MSESERLEAELEALRAEIAVIETEIDFLWSLPDQEATRIRELRFLILSKRTEMQELARAAVDRATGKSDG